MKIGKSNFKLWMFLFVAAAFMVSAGGCGGGNDGAGKPDPETTTDKLAALVGTVPDIPFVKAFEARLLNKTDAGGGSAVDTNAQILVLHNSNVDSLTAAQKKSLQAAYEREAAIVLIEPTYSQLNGLAGNVGHTLAAAEDKGDDLISDIYAFTLTKNPNGTEDIHTYVLNVRVDGKELTDAEYGAMLKHFMEWLDRGGAQFSADKTPAGASRASDANNALQDIINKQSITFSNTISGINARLGGAMVWSFNPSTNFVNTYYVYALYSFDQGADYYIIDQEAMVVNGPMYYGGIYTNDNKHWMGFYFYDYKTDHYLRTAANGNLLQGPSILTQPQPTTSVGSSSTQTSQSFTIGGSIGFNGTGGTGSVSGSSTYTSSRTTSASDLQIGNESLESDIGTTNTTNARWTYKLSDSSAPQPVNNWTIFYPHDSTITPNPPVIATSTGIFYNSWIWKIPDPEQHSGNFKVYCRYTPRHAYCYAYAYWYSSTWDAVGNFAGTGPLYEQNFTMTPPPRTLPTTPSTVN
ncbi:MAG: hypothetical protein LBL51_05975 [Synergistaceae bacterium]|nr:hypothetical protein [Synergistaceae bacterium]